MWFIKPFDYETKNAHQCLIEFLSLMATEIMSRKIKWEEKLENYAVETWEIWEKFHVQIFFVKYSSRKKNSKIYSNLCIICSLCQLIILFFERWVSKLAQSVIRIENNRKLLEKYLTMESITTLIFDSVDVLKSILRNDAENIPTQKKSIFFGKA